MRNLLLAVVGLAVFAGMVTAAPVPKALLKKKPLRATIQPLPGEKLFSVDWKDAPFEKVMEDLEKLTGLYYLSKDVPEVKITLKAEEVCLPELFAQLDELVFPTGWVILRKTQSLCLHPADIPVDRKAIPRVDLKELERRMLHEPLWMILAVDDTGVEAGEALGKKIGGRLRVSGFGEDKLLLDGNGETLRAFVAEMGDRIKE